MPVKSGESLVVSALKCLPIKRTPIWLMRQAGRYMPKYRAIREKVSFLELCRNSELAAQVTLMAVEDLGVDAAIIFADILLPVVPLGAGLTFAKGDGPVIAEAIRSLDQVQALRVFSAKEELAYVLKAISITKSSLKKDVPLLGFAGAPFTLASYLIEGGSSKSFEQTKRFMYNQPEAWQLLMNKIADVTSDYLRAQVAAGCDAVQLFDSWVGALSPDDYRQYVLPYSKKAIDGLGKKAPLIHFGTGCASLLELMEMAGGEVIGLDWRVDLADSWKRLGYRVGVQGNLDPTVLLSDRATIEKQARNVLEKADGRPGHIFNIGHGILPSTPMENVQHLVEFVKNFAGTGNT